MARSVDRMACSINPMAILYSSGDRDWNKRIALELSAPATLPTPQGLNLPGGCCWNPRWGSWRTDPDDGVPWSMWNRARPAETSLWTGTRCWCRGGPDRAPDTPPADSESATKNILSPPSKISVATNRRKLRPGPSWTAPSFQSWEASTLFAPRWGRVSSCDTSPAGSSSWRWGSSGTAPSIQHQQQFGNQNESSGSSISNLFGFFFWGGEGGRGRGGSHLVRNPEFVDEVALHEHADDHFARVVVGQLEINKFIAAETSNYSSYER